MPSYRPIGVSLNAAASVARKWAKSTTSKLAPRTTTAQKSHDCTAAMTNAERNSELPEIDLSSFIDDQALCPSLPCQPRPPKSADLATSPVFHSGRRSSNDIDSTLPSLIASSSTSNSTTTSAESSPSSRAPKSPHKALPQDDYFYLYLAPSSQSTQFKSCQSDSLPSVFEDDSDDEQPIVRKVTKKVAHKPSKSDPNVIAPLNPRLRSPKLIASRSSHFRNSTQEKRQSTEY